MQRSLSSTPEHGQGRLNQYKNIRVKRLLFIYRRAKHSRFFLWLLNRVLGYSIPFNKPHGIKLTAVHDDGVSVRLPYRRKNLNHLKGIHACALATMAEFSSGIALITGV